MTTRFASLIQDQSGIHNPHLVAYVYVMNDICTTVRYAVFAAPSEQEDGFARHHFAVSKYRRFTQFDDTSRSRRAPCQVRVASQQAVTDRFHNLVRFQDMYHDFRYTHQAAVRKQGKGAFFGAEAAQSVLRNGVHPSRSKGSIRGESA